MQLIMNCWRDAMPDNSEIVEYQATCEYCQREITIFPPYKLQQNRHFWAQCPHDICRKPTKYYFINGRIAGRKTPLKFKYFTQLKDQGGVKGEIADLAQEGCESAYLDMRRGAAITFRTVTELFTISELLGINPNSEDLPSFSDAIREIRNRHVCTQIVTDLCFIKNLGDTAAHPRISDRSRFIPFTPLNIDYGKSKLEEVIRITYGW